MGITWGVIPVAGRGTRMLPLSRAVPKELLPLGRKPVLQHVIEELVGAGLRNLLMVTSAGKPAIREYLEDDSFWREQLRETAGGEVRFCIVEQANPKGLGDAVLQAAGHISDPFFAVALGDCVFRGPLPNGILQRMVALAPQNEFDAMIALEQVDLKDVSKYGITVTEPLGSLMRVRDLIEKPAAETAPSRWAIAGRYILPREIFDWLNQTRPGRGGELQLTDAIRGLIQSGRPVIGVPLAGGERRFDVGEFAPYVEAFAEFAADAKERIAAHSVSVRPAASSGRLARTAAGVAFARAGLLGNPSDGYGGKTLSCIVANWRATVDLVESDKLRFQPGAGELLEFESPDQYLTSIRRHGYYGGMRLMQAAAVRFFDYCRGRFTIPQVNFTASYQSSIPRQLGLGGSSAIVVATLRALSKFYAVDLPKEWLPSLALSAETRELGIAAGLQDRVIQTYEGLMFMDFSPASSAADGDLQRGVYERIDATLLPELYIAWLESASEPTEVIHNDLRLRFDRGDPQVTSAMPKFAEFAARGRQALLQGDRAEFDQLMNANFDLRRSICRILPEHSRLVDVARSVGVSAKFCGSGGAIVGSCENGDRFEQLSRALRQIGAQVVRPRIGIWHDSP